MTQLSITTNGTTAPGLAARMLMMVEEWRGRQRLRREFEVLRSNGMLDAVLADATISKGELDRVVANHPASRHLLSDMVARLGLGDEFGKDPTIVREMSRACTLCAKQGQCKRWFRTDATEGYEAFCPNAARLNEMRRAAALV